MEADQELDMVRVRIQQNKAGLYMATSPDISGLYVAHRDLNAILADIPNIVRLWFRRQYGLEVRVFQETVSLADGNMSINAIAVSNQLETNRARA